MKRLIVERFAYVSGNMDLIKDTMENIEFNNKESNSGAGLHSTKCLK